MGVKLDVASRFPAVTWVDADTRGEAVNFVMWGPGMGEARCYPLFVGDHHVHGALRAEIAGLCPGEGILWPLETVVPAGADGPGVVITTEGAAAQIPVLEGFGPPELSRYVSPRGVRVAFYRISGRAGRVGARP